MSVGADYQGRQGEGLSSLLTWPLLERVWKRRGESRTRKLKSGKLECSYYLSVIHFSVIVFHFIISFHRS